MFAQNVCFVHVNIHVCMSVCNACPAKPLDQIRPNYHPQMIPSKNKIRGTTIRTGGGGGGDEETKGASSCTA